METMKKKQILNSQKNRTNTKLSVNILQIKLYKTFPKPGRKKALILTLEALRGIKPSQFNKNARIKLWNRPFNIESENCNLVLAKGLLQFPTNKLKTKSENQQKHSAKKKILKQ